MRLKQISKRLTGGSIQKKFLFCLITLNIIPLLLSYYLIYHSGAQDSEGKHDETLYSSFMEKSNSVRYLIQDMDTFCLEMSANTRLRGIELSYRFGNLLSYERQRYKLYQFLADTMSKRHYVSGFYMSSGDALLFQYGRDTLRYEQQVPYLGLRQGTDSDFVLTRPEPDQYFREPQTAPLISVVYGTNVAGKPLQFRYSLDESYVYSLIESSVYSGTREFLVDSGGTILSTRDKGMIGMPISESELPTDLMSTPGYRRVLIGGEYCLQLVYPIPQAGWSLVYIVPTVEFNAQASLTVLLTFVSIGICLVFGALFYAVLSRAVIRPVAEIQLREKEAQLKALISQINPHFLYNTLDSIRFTAILNKDVLVATQIETLSNLFRHVLNTQGEFTTVGKELKHLENYIDIQTMRLGDRIRYHIECPDELKMCRTLKLIVQPLVENAIVHGHENSLEAGNIWVSVFECAHGTLEFVVEDDGAGADDALVVEELSKNTDSGHMLALKNIKERIEITYGKPYGLRFESHPGGGTRVSVTIPKELPEENKP